MSAPIQRERAELASGPSLSEPWPVESIAGSIASGVLLLCDHAANTVPADLADLGVPAEQFERHIAYDIGAAAVTRALARRLGAPAILTRFSRLVIDPNRGRDDPTLVMQLSDGAVVPGNAGLSPDDILGRIERFYDPYDEAIGHAIQTGLERGHPPVIVTIHSFTPSWRGWPRPWHVGILWDTDQRFARPLLDGLSAEPGLVVGDNEPYDGALAGDTIDRHATVRGLASALIEIRQDLIAGDGGAEEWAERFARLLGPLAQQRDLRLPRPLATRTRDRLRRH